mgnify:CR=1 FL=1
MGLLVYLVEMGKVIHKILAILLISIICISAIFLELDRVQAFSGGNGTSGDPYQITTPDELQSLNNYLGSGHSGKYFKVMNDLNLSVSPYNTGNGWTPIGSSSNRFYGKFNGNYKTITGLFINTPSSTYRGLFGYIASGAIVENTLLTDVNVTASSYDGALAGENDGTVQNAGVIGGTVVGGMRTGGLV